MPSPLLILASQSPRRSLLLKEANIAHQISTSHWQDPDQPEATTLAPEALVTYLATRKANALCNTLPVQKTWVLSADTLCIDAAGHLLGKPVNASQAKMWLKGLIDCAQQIITGVCLQPLDAALGEPLVFSDIASLKFGVPPEGLITKYINNNQWQGKSGGYNLSELQSLGWPITCEGDPATVMGLPMQQLLPWFDAHGFMP